AGVVQSANLLRGWWGLAAAYAAVQVPLMAGLIKGRAPLAKFVASPVVALPLTAAVAVGLAAAAPLWHELGVVGSATLATSAGAALTATLGYVAGRLIARGGGPPDVHQRGALLADFTPPAREHGAHRVQNLARGRALGSTGITLAGFPLTREDEVKHFK